MSKEKSAQIFHFSLQGKRDYKYDFLNENSLSTIDWKELTPTEPNFFFVEKDFAEAESYEKGFHLKDLFPHNGNGIKSNNDYFLVDFEMGKQKEKIDFFIKEQNDTIIFQKLKLQNGKYWNNEREREKIIQNKNNKYGIKKYLYRPFDFRFIYYQPNLIEIGRGGSSRKIMMHFDESNFALINCKQFAGSKHFTSFITKTFTDMSSQPFAPYNIFPLYLYPEKNAQQSIDLASTRGLSPLPQVKEGTMTRGLSPLPQVKEDTTTRGHDPLPLERVPNLNMEIVKQIAGGLGLSFVADKQGVETPCYDEFAPIDILDYIYAVLHSPTYREKYKEFLKIDFPRVPFPTTRGLSPLPEVQQKFWQLVKLGGEIRQIHLLESPKVEEYITQFNISGDDVVVKPRFETMGLSPLPQKKGRVYINETQYFDHVPQVAWDFYIGGYQPAQKWLKDRKDRKLEFEDILHYQKIIVALAETDRIMKEIDEVGVEFL